MKNEGLLRFYTNAVLYNKGFAKLGMIRKCAESSRMNSEQKDAVNKLVNIKLRVKGDKA